MGSMDARARARRNALTPFRIWLWQNWPKLLISTVFGLYLIHWVLNDRGIGSDDNAQRLRSNGESRVRGGKVLLSDLISSSIHLSEIAAHEIIDVKLGGNEDSHVKGKTDEGVDEPVTLADGRSNSVFVNGLRQLFPGINILSEETDPEAARLGISFISSVTLEHDPWLDLKDVLITVDPLDATKEFTEDLLQYVTTMVCVVHKGVPIAGIINEPFIKDEGTIWGVALEDGYKTVHGIQRSDIDGDDVKKNVVISRSHTGAGADVVSEFLPGKKPVFAGGSGYKALRVLKGEADAYVHVTKIKAWDVCAADAVVRSAGGKFTDLKGHDLEYHKESPVFPNGIIAAADPTSHQWYVDKLQTVTTAAQGHR